MHSIRGVFTVLALCFLSNVEAFWRMNCATIQKGRIDPLVNPGDIAGHAHTIIGGSNIGINSTGASMSNSACTSCEIGADKSAYWTPILYYAFKNGTFLEVPHNGGVVYYLGRGPNRDKIVPFPKGLQILTGNNKARSYDSKTLTWGNAQNPGRPVADRVSFACLDRSTGIGEKHYMWKTDCSDGMRAQIHFQSCWNGQDLYKADNSHVAYLSSIDNGICPPTHPVQIPHLFLETMYSVNNVPKEDGGRFVFSQGDTTGYGFHGDFQNGWDSEVLAEAVDECLSADNAGTIAECPILQASQTSGYSANCPLRPPQIGEKVTGFLEKLPGCITITSGPEDAPSDSMACGPNVVKPVVTSTVDSAPWKTNAPKSPGDSFGISTLQKYVGCFNDSVGGRRALNAASMANSTAMTVELCQTWCQSKGYRLSGVEYAEECKCDNVLNPTIVRNEAQCTWLCSGTLRSGGDQQVCGGYGYISIYNNTDPSFKAIDDPKNSAPGTSAPGTTASAPTASSPTASSPTASSPIASSPIASSTTTSSTTAPSTTAPSDLKPFPSNYVGCATDGRSNTRILTGRRTSQANMNAATCQAFCAEGDGAQYYGLEYGNECWCGNFLQTPNFVTNRTSTPSNSTCNMRCSGARDELCGGPNALSLYKETSFVAPIIKSPVGQYTQKQCLADAPASRALRGAQLNSANMTPEVCSKFCLGKRMKYFGVEYGAECFCDNTIRTSSKPTQCAEKDLMLCSGDRKQYCGGSGFMNLYFAATL